MSQRFIEIDGHKVDADKVDLFYNADDGSRVSDEQWDISAARTEAAEALEGDAAITWEPIN